MVVWWAVMAIGVALYVASASGTMRAYRNRRVPRLGFFPPRSGPQPATWTWAVMGFTGIILFTLAAARLSGTEVRYYAYLGGAVAVGLLGHTAVILVHNSRVPSTSASARTQRGSPQPPQ